jgi:hypothetical protein
VAGRPKMKAATTAVGWRVGNVSKSRYQERSNSPSSSSPNNFNVLRGPGQLYARAYRAHGIPEKAMAGARTNNQTHSIKEGQVFRVFDTKIDEKQQTTTKK